MKLVIGMGVVGTSVVDFFKAKDICFYDDVIKSYRTVNGVEIPFFESWDLIDLVIVSPGLSHTHFMIKEAEARNIKLTTDIELFLSSSDYPGIKIGITGTNGKSTLCALLKYILGDLAELGGNFGVSPVSFSVNNFYILELSSYQLSWLSQDIINHLTIGVITNIGTHHLSYHKSKEEYVAVKKRITAAQNFINAQELQLANCFPKNYLFKRAEYQKAWTIILKILDILKLDEQKAMTKLESYVPLKYRQECIQELPLVINDSKSTNVESMKCAINNMMSDFILISQIFDYNLAELQVSECTLLKKIFILSNNPVVNLTLPYQVSNSFERIVNNALTYAKLYNCGVLFSPGLQSFEFFKNFEDRGAQFNELVVRFFKKV